MTDHTSLSPVIAEHVRAVNAVDEDAIVATFSEGALVNDARREFWGLRRSAAGSPGRWWATRSPWR
jgi:hypothetical protein